MIAFGVAVACEETYERFALAGLQRAREHDSPLFERRNSRSLFATYNEFLDEASALEDLEAVVLLHEDTEILDDRFPEKIRRCMADPGVAVVGVIGAIDVTSIAWWEGSRFFGRPGAALAAADAYRLRRRKARR